MKDDKPAVGFLNPQDYMQQAIDLMGQSYEVHVLTPQSWEDSEMEAQVAYCREHGIEAVGGFAQKDAFHHVLINERLGNVVPSRLAFLHCMNKYLSRRLEPKPFWFAPIDPIAETDDAIIARIEEWPFMLKNTSLSLGQGIFKIVSEAQLREVLAAYRENEPLQHHIAFQTAHFTRGVDPEALPSVIPPFIAEHAIDLNETVEYCYEGYVTADGRVVHYGLTEEVYFTNHQALGYLTPPMSLRPEKAGVIERWIEAYMGRLVELGYRNQFFNLEFWIMPDGSVALTEINPRAAHSYHYNYLYSFGCSLYEDNLELVRTGREPSSTPWQLWRSGEDFVHTLIVLITSKEAGKVEEILDYNYVEYLEKIDGVLIRHNKLRDEHIAEGELTVAGVMLLQLWVTGRTPEEVIAREREIREKIYLRPQDAGEYPPHWTVAS